MTRQDEIYDIDRKLDLNGEKKELFKRRLNEIEEEERIYYSEARAYEKRLEDLSRTLSGNLLTIILNEAFFNYDENRKIAEKAFMSEKNRIEDDINTLNREYTMLSERKSELRNEEKND